MDGAQDQERLDALEQYKNKLLASREMEAKLKSLRLEIKGLQKAYDTTEDNIKALQSVGQIIGEVLKQLDEERCKLPVDTVLSEYLRICTHKPITSHRESFFRASIRRWLSVEG